MKTNRVTRGLGHSDCSQWQMLMFASEDNDHLRFYFVQKTGQSKTTET